MKRNQMTQLMAWKNHQFRKPLILRGARQTGKTWLLQEFGRSAYQNVCQFNFEETPGLSSLFSSSLDPHLILKGLSAAAGTRIDPADTLIIFDEIQEAPRALTSLKYFAEKAPEYHLVCAGSLLGVSLSPRQSFPVGKVDFLDLYPLSFDEYLSAAGEETLIEYLKTNCVDTAVPNVFAERLLTHLKTYFITGGMPGPLAAWFATNDFAEVETIQKHLLSAYEADFAKHAPGSDIPKLRRIWDTIPSQLGRENKKFMYSELKKGGRATEYEDALAWLKHAGLIHQVFKASKPGLPLSAYEETRSFKLYLHDVGLLRMKAGLPFSAYAEGRRLFMEFKGALTENFVLNELLSAGYPLPHYWASNADAEVDFLLQAGSDIFPVEVKSSINVKARSLQVFRDKYQPSMMLRSSLQNLRRDGDIMNVPLYCLFYLNVILQHRKHH